MSGFTPFCCSSCTTLAVASDSWSSPRQGARLAARGQAGEGEAMNEELRVRLESAKWIQEVAILKH